MMSTCIPLVRVSNGLYFVSMESFSLRNKENTIELTWKTDAEGLNHKFKVSLSYMVPG